MQKYGIIKLHIKELMDSKNISRKCILEKTRLKNEVFNRYSYNDIKKADFKVLCKICSALECDIVDIISYEEDRIKN